MPRACSGLLVAFSARFSSVSATCSPRARTPKDERTLAALARPSRAAERQRLERRHQRDEAPDVARPMDDGAAPRSWPTSSSNLKTEMGLVPVSLLRERAEFRRATPTTTGASNYGTADTSATATSSR